MMERIPAEDLHASYPDLLPAEAVVWVGVGWSQIVSEALDSLYGQPVVVRGIREHCAGLQVMAAPYEDGARDLAAQVCEAAWERSRHVCEACGQPGRPRVPGPGVRCDRHAIHR